MNILIVDDEMMICDGTVNRIIRMNIEDVQRVDAAYSAKDAIIKLGENNYQMMFTDIRMEGIDGLELIGETKKLYPDLHCVIITAYDQFQYAQQAIRLGVQDFLVKPCSEQDMREQILMTQQKWRAVESTVCIDKDEDQFIQLVEKYIRDHPIDQIDLSSAANYLNYSYSYFSRYFQKKIGKSFSRYIQEVKMTEICQRLKSGERVVDIAMHMGYQNSNNLTRAFTREFGCSPSKWLSEEEEV